VKTDVHVHLFSEELAAAAGRERLISPEHFPVLTPEETWEKAARRGADAVVLRGWPFKDQSLCEHQNHLIKAAVRELGKKASGLAVVSPLAGKVAVEEAKRCLASGFSGLGEFDPVHQEFALDDVTFQQLCQISEKRGTPVAFYTEFPVGQDVISVGEAVISVGESSSPAGKTITPDGEAITLDGEAITPDGEAAEMCGEKEKKIIGTKEWLDFISCHRDLLIILSHYGGGLPFYALMRSVKHKLARTWFDSAPDTVLFEESALPAAKVCLNPGHLLYGSNIPFQIADFDRSEAFSGYLPSCHHSGEEPCHHSD
jgi:predicted TIM-barrel fold metal-dependent hydrolase